MQAFRTKPFWGAVLALLGLGLGAAGQALAVPEKDGDLPVAPLPPTALMDWPQALVMKNDALLAGVVPSIGRLALWTPAGGSNLLHMARALRGQNPLAPANRHRWSNFGGEWVWPVAQAHWPRIWQNVTPTARLLDGRPWEARAWKTAAGQQVCVMTQTYGAPVEARMTRTLRLHPGGPSLDIEQELERTAPSDIPLLLWNVCQVVQPRYIALPVGDDPSTLPRSVAFDAAEASCWHQASGVRLFDVRAGREHRLVQRGGASWIAAAWDRHLLLMESVAPGASGTDSGPGGVAFYVNATGPYAEIELMTPEQPLAEGARMARTIRLRYFPLAAVQTPDELAARIRAFHERAPSAAAGD